MADTPDLEALAERLESGKREADTLRFSECIVPDKRGGHRWGAVASTSPEVIRLLCAVWNARKQIAAALRSQEGPVAMDNVERLKTAFVASLTNANAGMRWLDHDSMDEMIAAAWVGFEGPALAAIPSTDDGLRKALTDARDELQRVSERYGMAHTAVVIARVNAALASKGGE